MPRTTTALSLYRSGIATKDKQKDKGKPANTKLLKFHVKEAVFDSLSNLF
jgi:hypothetical protein